TPPYYTGVTMPCWTGCPLRRPVSGWIVASARVVGANEVADPRHDLFAPFAAVEDAVMADSRLLPMHMPCAGNVRREGVRGFGLANPGDVVELALDRHQSGLDRRRLDRPAATHPDTARQPMLLEHDLDGLQIELGGEVHHREI